MDTIAELMTKGAVTCSLTDTLDRAAQIMWDHDCDAVPVTDERGRTIGIVTDRDVSMAAYTQAKPLSQIPVSVAASRHLIAASADDSVERVAEMMQAHRVRRVPILSGDGKTVGIVGLGDLARHVTTLRPRDVLGPDVIARTLATLSEPHASMAKAPVFHVRTLDGGWMVFDREGNRVSELQRTQSDGVVHAKELARRAGSAQVIVHRDDGTVASEFFYQREERSSLASDDAVPTFAASRPARARRAAGGLGRILSAMREKVTSR